MSQIISLWKPKHNVLLYQRKFTYAECGDESFILNKLQDICHELNELRQYDILNALPKLIKDSPNEGYVVDSNAFDECMNKVLYKR